MSTRISRAAAMAFAAILFSPVTGAEPATTGAKSAAVSTPPAALAPAQPSQAELLAELQTARHDVLEARRELDSANAAVARGMREHLRERDLLALKERQRSAREELERAKGVLPPLVAQARNAGISTVVLRQYEHSIYGY